MRYLKLGILLFVTGSVFAKDIPRRAIKDPHQLTPGNRPPVQQGAKPNNANEELHPKLEKVLDDFSALSPKSKNRVGELNKQQAATGLPNLPR